MKRQYKICSSFSRILILTTVIIAMVLVPEVLVAQNQISLMKQHKQIIQEGFENWAKGKGSFFDLLADDAVWIITGKSPISKTYTSRKQFLEEAIAPINERLSQKIIPELKGLYTDGDMVIALWEGKAIARDGMPYNNTYSWYMKMKDNKITHAVAFFDSIDLADLWKRVPGLQIP